MRCHKILAIERVLLTVSLQGSENVNSVSTDPPKYRRFHITYQLSMPYFSTNHYPKCLETIFQRDAATLQVVHFDLPLKPGFMEDLFASCRGIACLKDRKWSGRIVLKSLQKASSEVSQNLSCGKLLFLVRFFQSRLPSYMHIMFRKAGNFCHQCDVELKLATI